MTAQLLTGTNQTQAVLTSGGGQPTVSVALEVGDLVVFQGVRSGLTTTFTTTWQSGPVLSIVGDTGDTSSGTNSACAQFHAVATVAGTSTYLLNALVGAGSGNNGLQVAVWVWRGMNPTTPLSTSTDCGFQNTSGTTPSLAVLTPAIDQPTGICMAMLGTGHVNTTPQITTFLNGTGWTQVSQLNQNVAISGGTADNGISGAYCTVATSASTPHSLDAVVISGLNEKFVYGTFRVAATQSITLTSSHTITNTQTFGAITTPVLPAGFTNDQTLGSLTLTTSITFAADGFTNSPTLGTPGVSAGGVSFAPSGFTNDQSFGDLTFEVEPGTQDIAPSGLTNTNDFGTPDIAPVGVIWSYTGFDNDQDFGDLTVTVQLYRSVEGIASTNAFGTPQIATGTVFVDISGFTNSSSFGTPDATTRLYTKLAGFTNDQSFGTPFVDYSGNQHIVVAGLNNTQDFGAIELLPGGITIDDIDGIDNTQTFGALTLLPISHVVADGFTNDQTFGTPELSFPTLLIQLTGFTNTITYGTPDLGGGELSVEITGYANVNSFGITKVYLKKIYKFADPVIWPDLWADPDAFAVLHGVTVDEATEAISKASWILYELSNHTVHGPACWIDVYEGLKGDLITILNGPVDGVSQIEWMTDCGGTVTDEDSFCLVGPETVMIPGCGTLYASTCCRCGGCNDVMVRVTYSQQSTLVPGASRAAEALAAEYLKAAAGKPCKLPDRITTVTRQGVSWVVLDPQDFLKDGLTGITAVDAWLSVARHGTWRPVKPHMVDPLRGRFVSSTRLDCVSA